MSYTLTLDIPKKTGLYVQRQGPRLQAELSVLFAAIVSAKMKCDAENDGVDETPGPRLLASFREGDAIISGKKKTKWFTSARDLVEDCLA